MKKISRNNLIKRITSVLGNNEGASMVLVSVLAIIVLTAVVVLRLTTTTFMASANRQLNQDQAYELAASLGESINLLIQEDKYDIYATQLNPSTGERDIYTQNDFQDLPDASVVATVSETSDGTGRLLTVKAAVGGAEYVYTREYRQ